ncbi:hypothetical protein [Marinobacter xiaoshiensis]|uniref:Uncharacterized protein n=1 Tax=Marinobacter xiaoshiensis TaxID=3073652 RepID=A0ABU2HMA2_9GAMM|nr:hypothetical protein [Marinobacter sp. F60267]MDS1311701.1 hypothetical protein [Marinobacter sp. F60267]
MSDSRLNCEFPETDIQQQLEKRFYRTFGERLASPPARKVGGVSDSSVDMGHSIANFNDRFIDVRTDFLTKRLGLLPVINIFMVVVLLLMWIADQFYSGALLATALLLLPLWTGFIVYEIFCPYTLPVRIDRSEDFVYVAHRGTFYRVPWDELEVTFSYNFQYMGSGVAWSRQYYSHVFLRQKYYFCGKPPKSSIQRKRLSSYFDENKIYRKWNFIVRFYQEGLNKEDCSNLETANYDLYVETLNNSSFLAYILDYLSLILFVPTMIWAKFSPFKYKWPSEIEEVFGKANYY